MNGSMGSLGRDNRTASNKQVPPVADNLALKGVTPEKNAAKSTPPETNEGLGLTREGSLPNGRSATSSFSIKPPEVTKESEAVKIGRRPILRNVSQYVARSMKQALGINPFHGESLPSRVPLFSSQHRPTVPFPTPWNYKEPIAILDTFFVGAEREQGTARHNRYLSIPGIAPILVSRDPAMIRAITSNTGNLSGQFDRDTMPSEGIARATGSDTLLYSNGDLWKFQRKLAASPFGKTKLFRPEKFKEFEDTFRTTVSNRLEHLRDHLKQTGKDSVAVQLEPEVKALMLEMLANNFFGATIPYQEIRDIYVPTLERVIDRIVYDTVSNRLRIPIQKWPPITSGIRNAQRDLQKFEELVTRVLEGRQAGRGLWSEFKVDSPDAALRSNLKVFLAGALEATTSYACWAISHIARNPEVQSRLYQEIGAIEEYTPEHLENATYLRNVLDETLRLTPSLYFLPRKANCDIEVITADKRQMIIPAGTHVLLDVWHANRNEELWGKDVTGYSALDFAPNRWPEMAARGLTSKEMLHFGFGHGPRVCPGKHLGELETALVVSAMVKIFEFEALRSENLPRAGVSTKPRDGTEVVLRLRDPFKTKSDPINLDVI